ncbi:MAG: alanine:cation symporter family protein, partial [Blautia massiliensis (ex Durand et al. 2017)]
FYRAAYVAVAALAPVTALDLVWTVADTLNALMAVPNLIAVLLLSGVVVRETERYLPDLDRRCEDPIPTVDR